ncbi:MAG: hypothetical protein ACKOOL_01330 [Novosphingobium sp.]
MRENLNQLAFVYTAYGLGIGGTVALVWQSLAAMRRAEARRDRSREQ